MIKQILIEPTHISHGSTAINGTAHRRETNSRDLRDNKLNK